MSVIYRRSCRRARRNPNDYPKFNIARAMRRSRIVDCIIFASGGESMAEHDYKSTPSIIQRNDIGTARPGQKLRYADLTGREKRDYLFDQGIRPTAYGS